jgi:hypothetical protein
MAGQRTPRGSGTRIVLGLAAGLAAMVLTLTASQPAFATTGAGQNDPAWDYGRGGAEVPGQPACYLPAPSESMRKMYSLMRPSCFPGHMQ